MLAAWRTLRRVRDDEERSHPRREVHIAAKINLGGGSLHDCMVLDISDSGARIAIKAPQDIPDEFLICLTPHGFPVVRRCRLIWRSDSEIGVELYTGQGH